MCRLTFHFPLRWLTCLALPCLSLALPCLCLALPCLLLRSSFAQEPAASDMERLPKPPEWRGEQRLLTEQLETDRRAQRLEQLRQLEQPEWRLAAGPTYVPQPLPQDDDPDAPYVLPPAVEDDQLLIGSGPQLREFKRGFFQKFSLGGTWIARDGSAGLGIVESEAFVTFAIPAPTRQWPMLISPYLNIRSLDGPTSVDVPATLYETYLDFMWVPQLTDRLLGIVAVAPSVYSDFQQGDGDGFRWQGKGLVRWDIVPQQLQLLAGVLYLNRQDIRLLPAGGLIWKPNDTHNYELLFPRPKLARRIRYGETWADWVYVAGEFGGNSFAILHGDRTRDLVTLRDWRLLLGVERKLDGGAGLRAEVGLVFNRRLEFTSELPDVELDSTLLLRLVGTF
ncbi:MAG: hypothetical protein ACKOU6_12570 [Planctomycetota bacterium]